MSTLGRIVDHLVAGEHQLAQQIVNTMQAAGDRAAGVGQSLINAAKSPGGVGAIAGGFLGGPMGAIMGGAAGSLIGRRRPKDHTVPAGHPDRFNTDKCGYFDGRTGTFVRRIPYTLQPRIQLAASAQAIDTDLGDFFNGAASADVTTTGTVPGDVIFEEARLVVSLNELIASPVASPAIVLASHLIERVGGTEVARWPFLDFNPLVTIQGLVTSGGGAGLNTVMSDAYVPWYRVYDPNLTYALVMRTEKAFTPAAVVDLSFTMRGSRSLGQNQG